MQIMLPPAVEKILNMLHRSGYQAYAVGGCVRDSLLGKPPKDWDICTSARPEDMQRVFRGLHVVETGLKHGTLTVVLDHIPYEVTTFRVDGEYSDHRHPDGVTFVSEVREDLSRRDFTINAMAYNNESGLIDLFGGCEDLTHGILRCVGCAEKRFDEDALRILRAMRFASVYSLSIDPETSGAIHRLYPTLAQVAAERIRVELFKLLCGADSGRIVREYTDVMTFLLPEMKPSVGLDQKTPYHRYDVWEHSIRVMENVPPDEVLRFAALMHDSGKPSCFFVDEDGIGHATGHQKVSARLADEALTRLKADNTSRERIALLAEHHDIPLEPKLMRRRLAQFGEETLRQLIMLQHGDASGKGTMTPEAIEANTRLLTDSLNELLAADPCVTLKQLAVNGGDLMRLGIPKGPKVGQCLNQLLQHVIENELPNDRERLLQAATEWNTVN